MTSPHPIAHSANAAGRAQPLVEHLRNVADRASELAAPFGGGEGAYWAGLWHDLGKFHPDWQEFIAAPDGRRGPDHSSAGAVLAATRLPWLAGLIGGHHGGLPDREKLRSRIQKMGGSPQVVTALEEAGRHLGETAPSDPETVALPPWLSRGEMLETADGALERRRWEVFSRLLFSALVDADFLDTEAHFETERSDLREEPRPSIAELWERFEESHRSFTAKAEATELNRARNEIYHYCLAAAESASGLYRLTVPTGGGKTLSGLAFALRHALAHDLRRVVFAIPYTSIIEQTADEYRKVLGSRVLEHHSAIVPVAGEGDAGRSDERWRRLASENWDAPVVVTTTVQLFDSLFSNRPSACRKLHNLAGSVVVLDEVQTLPFELLAPILDALRELADHYRTTIVFCTATQPAVATPPYSEVFEAAREIVPDPERYFRSLRRVTYEVETEPWSWARVAEEMRTSPQSLAIVNTKKDALALLAAVGESALHLSTNLCGAHRRTVLAEVRRRLDDGEPCHLVSTQVVEAGVDLDFPLVLRAVGPLDRVVQAAGRCNREGHLGPGGGRVVVFTPGDASPPPPGVYKTGIDTARQVLAQHRDLHDPATYESYFRRLSQGVNLDRREIQPERSAWNYATVADRFRLIDDDSVPVLVPYPSRREMEQRIEHTLRGAGNPRAAFRELQPYLVTVRRRAGERYAAEGLLEEVLPGLWAWLGEYSGVAGLVERSGLTAEELVV